MIVLLILCLIIHQSYGYGNIPKKEKMSVLYSWKQLKYDFDGVLYTKDTPKRYTSDGLVFNEEVDDRNAFFIQYNNVPIGLEVFRKRMFVTVPRRRFGIPSTLNYIEISHSNHSPLLKPYPNVDRISSFVSVYRPRVDVCGRLWMVDTGLLEVPDNREQLKQPEIIVFDLKTDEEILRYPLKESDLSNGVTSGLISITVDVTEATCEDAFAYINDLATGGLVVFSLRERYSWRFSHPSFNYDPAATFQLGQFTINWKDGIFSIALSDPDAQGVRTAYYHPFISTKEFSITTDVLKNKNGDFNNNYKQVGDRSPQSQSASHVYHSLSRTLLFANIAQDGILCWNVNKPLTKENTALVAQAGDRGPQSQSASHVYHSLSRTLLFANIAQDGILCWNVNKPLTKENTALVAQDHRKLAYIADIKEHGDFVYVLVNQIHNFIYSTLDPKVENFFVLRANVTDLIKGSVCEASRKYHY